MITNIGLDLGMGACKLHGPAGSIYLPSHVSIAGERKIGRLAGMRQTRPPLKVTVDGRSFYVGDGAHDWGRPIENLDYDRLTGAPEMKAIVYGALAQYQALDHRAAGHEIALWVGMPLEPLTGEDSAETLTNVRAWLRGGHGWQADDGGLTNQVYEAQIGNVRITSQATGALFDYLLDDTGKFIPSRKADAKKEIGIISIGFNTVELLVVQDTSPVLRFTGGSTAGARRLLDLVNGDGLYSLGELDSRLRDGSLDTKAAIPIWAREVTGAVERTWGNSWRRFARVIVVGGGALLLNGHLNFAGKSHTPHEPVLSIARGLYKLAQMQEARK